MCRKSDTWPYILIGLFSTIILSFLVWLIYGHESSAVAGQWTKIIPLINAVFNTITTFLLIIGYYYIKISNGDREDNKKKHIRCMCFAVMTSALFLIGYVTYHYFHGDTKYLGLGLMRNIYFFILITHIILSVIMVPLVFTTLYQATSRNFEKHKKFARITFPIWLYVSITGVLIYLFLHK
jgi:putative membrane protein